MIEEDVRGVFSSMVPLFKSTCSGNFFSKRDFVGDN